MSEAKPTWKRRVETGYFLAALAFLSVPLWFGGMLYLFVNDGEIDKGKRTLPAWAVCLITVVGLAVIGGILIGACNRGTEGPAVTFEKIGAKGSTVFITLVSPSADELPAADLANRLRRDWQDNLIDGNMINVMVFDNKEAPERRLAVWDRLATMSDEEWASYQAQIYPHFIASYWRNKTSGLHEVEIRSRDANGDVVQTIEF